MNTPDDLKNYYRAHESFDATIDPTTRQSDMSHQQIARFLLQIIRKKDLDAFQTAINDAGKNPRTLIAAICEIALEINCNELTVPPAPLLHFTGHDGKTNETTAIAFRLNTARRVLLISPMQMTQTYGPDSSNPNGPLSTLIFESPEVLFQRVGTIASIPRTPLPPPVYQPVV